MKIEVIASTKPDFVVDKESIDKFGGYNAGVCYMKDNLHSLKTEPAQKTTDRIIKAMENGHHSVVEHTYISLYLEDVPKALAMLLNNEKEYVTSEKSGRYTKMRADGIEKALYDKWVENFTQVIENNYATKYPAFFTTPKIRTLARENARYLLSVFSPTSLVYTTSYRQLNYIYNFMQKAIQNPTKNKFYEMLKPAMKDFCIGLENCANYLDYRLYDDGYNREFSLVETKPVVPEFYFGKVYTTFYKGSFVELAQAQRNRSLNYSFSLLNTPEYYMPPMIKNNAKLHDEWLQDCEKVSQNMPQASLVNIYESGTIESFKMKLSKRICTQSQQEIYHQTNQTLSQYIHSLEMSQDRRVEELRAYQESINCRKCKEHGCALPNTRFKDEEREF